MRRVWKMESWSTAPLVRTRLALVAGAAVLCGLFVPPTTTAAASNGVVGGTVWRDLDADGIRDADEPGVPHVTIAVLGTSNRTVTGPSGAWTLSLAPGAATLSAITGWLPSACPGDLNCAAGRTIHQRFAVENQYVRARVTVPDGAKVVGLDLGLEPDNGDPTGAPTSLHAGNDRGDGSPRAHDLAVRHSSVGSYAGCADPAATRVCPIGTALPTLGQIYNQGTAWVTGVRFVLTIPPGLRLSSPPTAYRSTPAPTPTLTGRSGRTADGSRWVEYQLAAGLAPGSAIWFEQTLTVEGGPPSPKPYGTGSALDRKAYVSISQVTPADDDSVLRVDPRAGKDRGHNVNFPRASDDDTSDAIGFNVA